MRKLEEVFPDKEEREKASKLMVTAGVSFGGDTYQKVKSLARLREMYGETCGRIVGINQALLKGWYENADELSPLMEKKYILKTLIGEFVQ